MSKVKVELNREAVRALLRSDEMQAVCKEHADNIARRASGDYTVDVKVGKNRCNASISTNSWATINDNLRNNTLLKSIGG